MNPLIQPASHCIGAITPLLADAPMDVVVDLTSRVGFWAFVWLIPLCAFAFLSYHIVILPLRRQERTRFFLHLIESSLGVAPKDESSVQSPSASPRSIERALVDMSKSQDAALGVRFHLVAANMESGMRLGDALAKVPRFLPPQLVSMIRVGEKIGDLRKVLPACQKMCQDGASQSRSSLNYLILLVAVIFPLILFTLWVIRVLVVPRFAEMYEGMLGQGMSRGNPELFTIAFWMANVQIGIALVLYCWTLIHLGGPSLLKWAEGAIFPLSDWLYFHVPWRRLRLQRDFTAMLAMLLDSDIPEPEAVRLAASATGNSVIISRSERILMALKFGATLEEALRHMDFSLEQKWRLDNAARSSSGFLRSLAGWLEALDAKAFQQEQSAAHAITAGVVLFNGTIVALVVIGVFQYLTGIMNAAVLW